MMKIFESNIKVEESFSKGSVICSFATSDNNCTIGFIDSIKARPKTLIKGNELDNLNSSEINLVLRKESDKVKFNEIIIGNKDVLMCYIDKIDNLVELVDENLLQDKLETAEN